MQRVNSISNLTASNTPTCNKLRSYILNHEFDNIMKELNNKLTTSKSIKPISKRFQADTFQGTLLNPYRTILTESYPTNFQNINNYLYTPYIPMINSSLYGATNFDNSASMNTLLSLSLYKAFSKLKSTNHLQHKNISTIEH